MATLNVELSDSAYERLLSMADACHMPVSEFLEHLSQGQPRLSEEQMQEFHLSLAEDEAGIYASDEEVEAIFNSFKS